MTAEVRPTRWNWTLFVGAEIVVSADDPQELLSFSETLGLHAEYVPVPHGSRRA